MNGLQDSTAVVSGASSGIGRTTATRLASEGANVVAADVDTDGGEETVAQIEDEGGEATFVETDVTDQADLEAMVQTAVDTYGGLDIAFNNAGIEGEYLPSHSQTIENWQDVINVNLSGVFMGMREEIPVMLEDGGGAIVNTASVAAIDGFPMLAPYVASKHGVVGLTKTAAVEFGGDGLRVNAICPGVIDTPMIERTEEVTSEALEQTIQATPMGRLGDPEEIAGAVAWLCSDDASFITGEQLVIDGGFTVG